MRNPDPATPTTAPEPPAHTHRQAAVLLRRPFAPGRDRLSRHDQGAPQRRPLRRRADRRLHQRPVDHPATQRRRARRAGGWTSRPSRPSWCRPASKKLYLACRLTITLPDAEDGEPVEASYIDIGEMDARLVRRPQGALQRRAQARRRRRRHRHLPLHRARRPRAADRPRRPPGAGRPPRRRQERPAACSPPPPSSGCATATGGAWTPRRCGATSARSSPTASPRPGWARATPPTAPPSPRSESSAAEAAATAQPGERGELVAVDFAQLGPNGADGPAAA